MKKDLLNKWLDSLTKNIYALFLATRHPRVPKLTKVIVGLAIAYALSPIDLIPDFIPLLGYLDDLVLLPLLVWLAVRLVPHDVWQDCLRQSARVSVEQLSAGPYRHWITVLVVLIWLLMLAAAGWFLWRLIQPIDHR